MADKKESATKVITGEVRFSYAHVFEAVIIGDDGDDKDKKYSVCLLIPKSDKTTVAKINAAIEAAKAAGKTSKWENKIPAGLKLPLRDGDAETDKPEEYRGHWFINASSKSKPGVVDEDLNAIMERDQFYSGCYGRASINFYAFAVKGSKGIAAGLNNLQKLRDGEALAGFSTAEEDFGGAGRPGIDSQGNDEIDGLL